MSPGTGTNVDMVTMALNLKGDQAFQSLYSGVGLAALLGSAAIVFAYYVAKKPKWGIGTAVILVFFMNFLVSGLIAPIVASFSSGTGTINFTGNGKFKSLLDLSGIGQGQTLGSFIVCIVLVILLKGKFKWGMGASVVMIIVLPIFYLHWVLPLWQSANIGSVNIPFVS